MLKAAEIPVPIEAGLLQKMLMLQQLKISAQEAEKLKQAQTIAQLKEQLRLAYIRRYARSSEQFAEINDRQGNLFDEGEYPPVMQEPVETQSSILVAEHTRKVQRGKRQELPDYLPVRQIEYTLPEAELIGPNGEVFTQIGTEVLKQLEVIPAEVRIIEHIRHKYAVKGREELGVRLAPMPKQPIPKSIASPGLLAHIVQAKYEHHLPLYRQEQIWKSLDVHLPDNTLGRWMVQAGELVQPLVAYLMEEIKQHRHIHVDETPVTVIKDEHKASDAVSHQGYMWVYTNHLGVVFDYRSSRSGSHPEEMLEEFKGYVQTDAYAGYNGLFKDGSRKSVGCFAHARRKFADIKKMAGKKHKTPVVDHVLNLIAKLYHLESQAKEKELTETERYELRQEKAVPILKRLEGYLRETLPKTPPQGMLAKAMQYALNHWEALYRYTEDGTLNIDNNPAERAIKPFTLGRKNWLFAGNTHSAKAGANLYSLIESAKLYQLKIHDYLSYVFEHLPNADTPRKIEMLLPQYAQAHVPKIKPEIHKK
jgi:transposase